MFESLQTSGGGLENVPPERVQVSVFTCIDEVLNPWLVRCMAVIALFIVILQVVIRGC